ncbi:MAG: FtsX-like permease family protein [Methylobacteriaceae bacterium]|nr:FtsX-like permease family protein [Methylobacteriaceae bacterium]
MTATATALTAPRFGAPVLLSLALRDLRGGLRGFGVFLACIALGVAAIAGVGSVARGLSDGLAREGRTILGGDVAFSLIHRETSTEEAAFLATHGVISKIGTMRAMARRADGSSALVEIKAVGTDYPQVGTAVLSPAIPVADALAARSGVFGIAADAALLARLDLKIGDRLFIGDAPVELRAVLVSEPDKLAGGIGFGPRVLSSLDALNATGLVQPGSLVRWTYRVALSGAGPASPADDSAVSEFAQEAAKAFPEAGWEMRTRTSVSPQFSKNLERFTQFLTLVGLTALVVGGVGVANAVRGYIDRKRAAIATLKSLGATGSYVFRLMLTEVALIALVGVAIGLAVGAAMPFALVALFGAIIPFPLIPAVYPTELGLGALYGLLTALAFALAPLGRAHDVPVSALFRDEVEPDRRWPRPRYLIMVALGAIVLVSVAVFFAWNRGLAVDYAAATVLAFVLLRLVAAGVMALARAVPRPRRTELRLAIANIHRPGALTPSVVLSLGLGLALLVALTLIEGNIRKQLNQSQPGATPSFFFIDVQNAQAPALEAFLKQHAPEGKLDRVPMMRGRILRVGNTRAEDVHAKDDVAWVLEGDRGITFAATMPSGSSLAEGKWWPADYAGPPLVSMDKEIATGLGLGLGDKVTVNVLGRNILATIANLRDVNWRTFGINFVMVFSPNTFAGAPHTDLATLTFPRGADPAKELALVKEVATAFPTVTSVRVRDALDAVNTIVTELALAIRGAASVALGASMLVLAGALAAGQRARIYDAVVLKTLGATRARLLAAFVMEYGLIGLATAVFGVLAGGAAAYFVVTRLMQLDFVFLWGPALVAAGAALTLTIGLGLVGTWRVLGQKPAAHLRSL